MRRFLFWLPVLLVPGHPGPGAQELSTPVTGHRTGAIFDFDVQGKGRIVENGNGRAYSLDLVPVTATAEGLRLFRLTAPDVGRFVETDEWFQQVTEDVLATEEREGAQLLGREEMSLRVSSAPHGGLRLSYRGEDGRAYEDWLCSFRCCQHPVAAVARIEKDSDREDVRGILNSLFCHEWGPATTIPRELDGLHCAFPVLAAVRRGDGAETEVLRGELADCLLELRVNELADEAGARDKLAELFEWLDVDLRSPAEMRGMEVDGTRRVLWPLGAGTVVGGFVRMGPPDGDAVETQRLLMRAGDKVVRVSASYPARAREAAERDLQRLLDSLASDGIDVGREHEYIGDDLYLDLNERLPLERSEQPDGQHFEIHPTISEGSPATVFWIDVHEGTGEDVTAEALLEASAAKRLPGWELDSREKTVATLLGSSKTGWMARAHHGEEHARLGQFVLPFGERWVAAGMVCDEREAAAQSEILMRILDRMRDLRNSNPARYHDEDFALVIDPRIWTLQSLTREGERVVELTTGALRMSIRSHVSEAAPGATFLPQEPTPAMEGLAGEIEELGTLTERLSDAESDPVDLVSFSPRLFEHTLGVVASYVTTATDGQDTVHAILLVRRAEDWLEIGIEAPEDDLADRELAATLLDSLDVPGARSTERRTVQAPHLRLDVPAAFDTELEQAGIGGLLVRAPYSDTAQLLVAAVPLEEDTITEYELMDRCLDTERASAPPGTTEEEAEAPLIFRGAMPHAGKRLLLFQPDGVTQVSDVYAFRESGMQLRIEIRGPLNGMIDGAGSLRLLMRDVQLLAD